MAYLISHRHPFFHSIILMGAILLTFMVHKALIFTVNLLSKPGLTLRQIHPSLTCSLYAGFHFSLLDIIERPRDYPKEQRCAWGRDSWCYHPIDRMGEQQIRKCETTSDERCNGEWLHCQSEILWYLSAIPSSSCLSLLNLQQLCPKVWSSLSMGRSVHRLGKSYWNSILTSKTKNWIRSMSWYVIYGIFLQRNYPFFVCFLSCSTLLCIYVFVFSWVSMLKVHGEFYAVLADDLILGVLGLYCFVSVWFVGGLSVFHFYLICTNQARFFSF